MALLSGLINEIEFHFQVLILAVVAVGCQPFPKSLSNLVRNVPISETPSFAKTAKDGTPEDFNLPTSSDLQISRSPACTEVTNGSRSDHPIPRVYLIESLESFPYNFLPWLPLLPLLQLSLLPLRCAENPAAGYYDSS
jgi:hypothetical protein